MKRTLTFLALILTVSTLSATEYCPWFGPWLEVEGRATARLEAYPSINGHHCHKIPPNDVFAHYDGRKNINKSATNGFLDLSASMTYPERWSSEVEVVIATTRHCSFGVDSLKFTGRHLFFDDVIGDPLSLSAGVSAIGVFPPFTHDVSVFHHGGIAGEMHIAVGKEFICREFWTSRLWGVGAVGLGDVGSAWLRFDTFFEHNWWDRHHLRLSAKTLWGLGQNRLNLCEHFGGYGPIAHNSVDIGLRYGYFFEFGLTANIEYAYRVYARNCPQDVNILSLNFLYPFGL